MNFDEFYVNRMPEVLATELPSEVESDDTDDDSFLPDSHDPAIAAAAAAAVAAATGMDSIGGATASPASVRLILPKNRLSIQRRATVTGASPTSTRPANNIEQVNFDYPNNPFYLFWFLTFEYSIQFQTLTLPTAGIRLMVRLFR